MAVCWVRVAQKPPISALRLKEASGILFGKNARTTSCLLFSTSKERNYHQQDNFGHGHVKKWSVPAIMAAASIGGFYFFKDKVFLNSVQASEKDTPREGDFNPSLPSYTMEDVMKHDSREKRVWMTFRQGVYDVTDFIDKHPGGENILMGAGGAVDPFWNLYSIHLEPHVLKIMSKYRIGNISAEEAKSQVADLGDPFANEPKRHHVLIPASKQPFNAEPIPEILADKFVTPTELFYVRNHLPVPDIKEQDFELEVEGLGVKKPLKLKLADLKKLPKVTITASLQCAGNRRSEMIAAKPVRGLNWNAAAIGNAEWTGVRLYDLLKSAGVDMEKNKSKHVQFEGSDEDSTGNFYGASIPAYKAFDPNSDVIIAYEMNGEPLTRDHGYPARVIVPGVVAARSVKWLSRIVLADDESQSFWQQNDYKGFGPNEDADTIDWNAAPAIQEMPVTSAFTHPKKGDKVKVKNGGVFVKGYAWSGGGRPIIRVDVSGDGGKTWTRANLSEREAKCADGYTRCWSWTIWTARVPVPKGAKETQLVVKAVDSSYNTQPEKVENIWNFRGVLSNAYHKVNVKIA